MSRLGSSSCQGGFWLLCLCHLPSTGPLGLIPPSSLGRERAKAGGKTNSPRKWPGLDKTGVKPPWEGAGAAGQGIAGAAGTAAPRAALSDSSRDFQGQFLRIPQPQEFGLEKTFQNPRVSHEPAPTSVLHQTKPWSATPTRFWNISRDGDSTSALGSLFQGWAGPSMKEFSLISNLNEEQEQRDGERNKTPAFHCQGLGWRLSSSGPSVLLAGAAAFIPRLSQLPVPQAGTVWISLPGSPT